MDSVFQVMDSILSQWSLDSGFQSFVGFRSSVSCIPDSKAKDFVFHKQSFPGFRFHKQKLPGFRNPDSLTSFFFTIPCHKFNTFVNSAIY